MATSWDSLQELVLQVIDNPTDSIVKIKRAGENSNFKWLEYFGIG